jgi:hypothetical protein
MTLPSVLRSDRTTPLAKTLKVKDADGEIVEIEGPGEGWESEDLWAVGETYEVYKLPADAPHWSIDGF